MNTIQWSDPITLIRLATELVATVTYTNATNLVTSVAHGLLNGDKILVANSGGALPTELSATTPYFVINKTDDTFQLSLRPGANDQAVVTFSDDGSGTNTYLLQTQTVNVKTFRHLFLEVSTSGTATLTANVKVAYQEDVDFSLAASPTNRWSYVQIRDLIDDSSTDGDTGIVYAGTDAVRLYELNTNGVIRVGVDVSAWTKGNLDVKLFRVNA